MGADHQICKVAIIGAGYIAREHVRAFASIPHVRLEGIHSRTRKRAEALASEHKIPNVYDSIQELYEKTRADLVVVTVNELSMKEVSLACFAFPWAVLLEKPPGLTVPEAEEIQREASSRKRKVRVALNRQSYSLIETVINDLAKYSGSRFIKIQDQENPAGSLASGQPRQVAANWMYSNSIHMLDYFRLLARGNAVDVEPMIPWNPKANPCIVVAKITFDSDDVGLYEAVWNGPGPWAVTVTVPGRRWELRPLEQGVTQELGQRPVPLEVHPRDTQFKPGFRLQAEKAVQEALGQLTDLPHMGDALKTMRLISRIYPMPWI